MVLGSILRRACTLIAHYVEDETDNFLNVDSNMTLDVDSSRKLLNSPDLVKWPEE